jgi:hypothetical protein
MESRTNFPENRGSTVWTLDPMPAATPTAPGGAPALTVGGIAWLGAV